MTEPVTYELDDGIATLTLRNGKVNPFSMEVIAAVTEGLARAERDGAVVIVTGQPGVLSAGMDLKFLMASPANVPIMAAACGAMLRRMLACPQPVIVACTGNAVAGGALLLLAADFRIGADGPFAIGTNEVKIGIAMPHSCLVMAQERMPSTSLHRAVLGAEMFTPKDAVEAGFLDQVVAPEALEHTSRAFAQRLKSLNLKAYAETKSRLRKPLLGAFDRAAELDGKSAFFV